MIWKFFQWAKQDSPLLVCIASNLSIYLENSCQYVLPSIVSAFTKDYCDSFFFHVYTQLYCWERHLCFKKYVWVIHWYRKFQIIPFYALSLIFNYFKIVSPHKLCLDNCRKALPFYCRLCWPFSFKKRNTLLTPLSQSHSAYHIYPSLKRPSRRGLLKYMVIRVVDELQAACLLALYFGWWFHRCKPNCVVHSTYGSRCLPLNVA